jgi:hypothetical protein
MKKSFFTKDHFDHVGGQITHVPNPYRNSMIELACNSYGHLIARGETVTADQFADKIKAAYDCAEPHNAEVIRALGELL